MSDKDGEPYYTIVKHLIKVLPEVIWKVGYVPNELVALEETIRKHSILILSQYRLGSVG